MSRVTKHFRGRSVSLLWRADWAESTPTASMNVQSTENGVISSAAGADTVSGSRNLTATGLLGHNTTRTWNGTGTVTISRTVGITFNGTEFVPMTVGSQNYTLHLATGNATKN